MKPRPPLPESLTPVARLKSKNALVRNYRKSIDVASLSQVPSFLAPNSPPTTNVISSNSFNIQKNTGSFVSKNPLYSGASFSFNNKDSQLSIVPPLNKQPVPNMKKLGAHRSTSQTPSRLMMPEIDFSISVHLLSTWGDSEQKNDKGVITCSEIDFLSHDRQPIDIIKISILDKSDTPSHLELLCNKTLVKNDDEVWKHKWPPENDGFLYEDSTFSYEKVKQDQIERYIIKFDIQSDQFPEYVRIWNGKSDNRNSQLKDFEIWSSKTMLFKGEVPCEFGVISQINTTKMIKPSNLPSFNRRFSQPATRVFNPDNNSDINNSSDINNNDNNTNNNNNTNENNNNSNNNETNNNCNDVDNDSNNNNIGDSIRNSHKNSSNDNFSIALNKKLKKNYYLSHSQNFVSLPGLNNHQQIQLLLQQNSPKRQKPQLMQEENIIEEKEEEVIQQIQNNIDSNFDFNINEDEENEESGEMSFCFLGGFDKFGKLPIRNVATIKIEFISNFNNDSAKFGLNSIQFFEKTGKEVLNSSIRNVSVSNAVGANSPFVLLKDQKRTMDDDEMWIVEKKRTNKNTNISNSNNNEATNHNSNNNNSSNENEKITILFQFVRPLSIVMIRFWNFNGIDTQIGVKKLTILCDDEAMWIGKLRRAKGMTSRIADSVTDIWLADKRLLAEAGDTAMMLQTTRVPQDENDSGD